MNKGSRKLGTRVLSFLLALSMLLSGFAFDSTAFAEEQSISVAEAIAAVNTGTKTVKGYVVGTYGNGGSFVNSGDHVMTNLVLADNPDETNKANLLPVQLPSGNLRTEWNLKDHPENLGKLVEITGSLELYFSQPGLKNPKAISFAQAEPDPEPEVQTREIIVHFENPNAGQENYYVLYQGLTTSGETIKFTDETDDFGSIVRFEVLSIDDELTLRIQQSNTEEWDHNGWKSQDVWPEDHNEIWFKSDGSYSFERPASFDEALITQLQEAIDNAKAQDLSNKTPDSIKALQEEIAKAEDLLNAEIKTNEAFNAQIEALNNKINNLVEATLVSLHIGVYRYFDDQTIEDAQETDVLRNTFTENNLPVLKNVDTGATYEFNSINSNKKIISFKNVPNSGNYELTIPMQEGAKIVRLTDNQKVEREGEGVVSDTQVKFTLSDNQSFFDHRRIYYEQKSEDVTTTYQVRYEANGGTFVNVPEDLLSDEGQAAVIAKEKFNNFVQTTDWIYQYVNNRYMHIVKEGYTGSWYVKGTNTIVNNTFTINNLAKEVNFDFGNDNNELVLSMRWKPTTELNNLLQALKDKIAEAEDLDTSNKTDETVEALNNAVNAGKDLVNSQPTLSQIQEAIDNIDKAIEGLEENEVEIYKLTIDTSEEGVTIDEDKATLTFGEDEVKQLPYQFHLNLYKEGYTLTGYEVTEGSVFVNGEEVTTLGLYDKVSLTSDATIKPVWKVTEGKITLIIKNESSQVQADKFVIKAIAEDGTEYVFTSNTSSLNQRTWNVENLPNGKYKVVIEGLDGKYIESVTPFGHPDVQANTTYVLNEDGSITIDAKFLDDKPYNSFARYNVELADIYKLTIDTSEEGVTIDEDKATLTFGEDEVKQLPYQFHLNLYKEGYTLTGYEVTEGTVLVNGEEVTTLGLYDKVSLTSNATIKPVWKVTAGKITLIIKNESPQVQGEKYVIKAIAEDGTEYPFTSNKFAGNQRTWEALNLPNGKYKVVIEGLDGKYIESVTPFGHPDVQANTTYVLNEDGSITIDAKFLDDKPYNSFARYNVELADIYKLTIDTSEEGVTIDENKATLTFGEDEVKQLPYQFHLNLYKEGYTLTGYEVTEGSVFVNGEEVTTLGLYDKVSLTSDATIKPVWKVTEGKITLIIKNESPQVQGEKYVIKAIAEDGTEYPFTSNKFAGNQRTWEALNLPNGKYKVVIEGLDGKYIESVTPFGHPDVQANTTYVLNEDGSITIDAKFLDDKPYNSFARYNVELADIYKLTIDTSEEGVTIDEDKATLTFGEDEVKQLPYQFHLNLYKEGYTLTGYEVTEGSVFVNGEEVTILGLYDKVSLTSDATIKPVWKVTEGKITLIIKNESPQVQGEKYVIKAIAEDGTEYVFTSNTSSLNQRTWEALNLPNGKYKVVIEGLDGKYIESVTPFGHPDVQANTTYVLNEDGSITIDAKFLDDKPYNSFARYNVELADIYKVTIDTSEEGVTIDEIYKVMEADKAGNIELPYRHRMKLEKEGFTFDGYEVVEGKVLLKGNEVTRLGEFDRNIVIEGNVVLKPVWRATTGRVQLEMLGLDYKELRSIKLVAEDGTEYAFKSNSYTNVSRKYEAEKVPSGNYKVIIEDFDFNKYVLSVATEVKGGRYSTAELSMVGEDVLLDVKFDDNQSATAFARVGLNVELITSDLGVEVRDLNNRRTKDVTITVADEEGNEFTGEFNEYTQYILDKLVPGTYTIKISGLPEKVRTVINDTVANQIGVATQNDNEYTVELTGKENGRQYLAVKFEEIKDVEHKGYIIGLTNVRKSPNGEIIDQVILGTYLEGIVDPKNPNWVIIEHNGEKAYVYKDLIVSEMTPYKGYVVFDTNVRTYPNGDIVKVTGFKTYIDGYVIGDSRWVLFEENGNRRFIFKELVNPNLVPYEGYISNTSNVRSLDTKEVVGTLDIGDYVDGLYDSTEGYVLFKFNNQVRFVHRSLVHPEYKGKTGTAMKGSSLRLTPNGQILDVLKSDTKVKGVINPENPNWLMFKYNGRIVNIYLPLVK